MWKLTLQQKIALAESIRTKKIQPVYAHNKQPEKNQLELIDDNDDDEEEQPASPIERRRLKPGHYPCIVCNKQHKVFPIQIELAKALNFPWAGLCQRCTRKANNALVLEHEESED